MGGEPNLLMREGRGRWREKRGGGGRRGEVEGEETGGGAGDRGKQRCREGVKCWNVRCKMR